MGVEYRKVIKLVFSYLATGRIFGIRNGGGRRTQEPEGIF